MHRSGLATFSLLSTVVAYGYGGDSSSDSSSSDSPVDGVHVVKVGQNGLTFEPSEITAAVGDLIEFHFWPQAHSVAQSSFAAPCQPLNETGFFSGAIPVESGQGDEVFTVTVEDEDPMWFYCATGSHCQSGMVGVINPPDDEERTLELYADAAANATENVEPTATGGGTLGAPAAATETDEADAGIEMRGSIRWGLMSFGIGLAGFIGGVVI